MAYKRVSDQQFAASKHRYTDPRTGERVTSVTAVVGCFDSGDKLGAGAGAAVKLEREGKDYRAVWNAKKELGSRVHGFAELWMNGKIAQVGEAEDPYMDAFAAFCRDHSPEWIEVERAVVSSLGYGGRFDMIGGIGESFDLIDIKTGKKYVEELTLQLAGYRYADGLISYDDEGKASELDPMPHIDRCAGLYLGDDGSYDLAYVDADKTAFDAFKSLLSVKLWAAEVAKSAKGKSE